MFIFTPKMAISGAKRATRLAFRRNQSDSRGPQRTPADRGAQVELRHKARHKSEVIRAGSNCPRVELSHDRPELSSPFKGPHADAFVMMHEFEGLLFSDCAAFGRGIGQPDLEPKFTQIRNEFATPEDINDSPVTASSKRVEGIVPDYEKPLLARYTRCFGNRIGKN
jgi:hypothetical protein